MLRTEEALTFSLPSGIRCRGMKLVKRVSGIGACWTAAGLLLVAPARAENWPQWRGPRLDGTSLETNLPLAWNPTSNLLWKSALPGAGHASPIVWEDRVLTVAAEREERLLLCLQAGTGAFLWQQTVLESPLEKKHTLNSHASSTPATDGQRVFVTFLDRREVVVAAYDLSGRQLWRTRPGEFASVHGFCSSPVLFQDLVVVNCDHDGEGYIVALERATGVERWRIQRPNQTRSYCAPLIRPMAGRTQMVLAGSKCVTSYDPNDGRLLWIIDGPTEQFVASPVFSDRTGLLFITGGFPDHHILAIQPDGTGNVTGSKIVWRTTKGVAYVPSPLCLGDYFLVVSDSGIAHCFEAASGKILWAERMGEHHTSLVAAQGCVYFLNDQGTTRVVRPGPAYECVARSEIGEKTFASPALSGGRVYVRGDKHLFCLGLAGPLK
jgi:outer membrane protein assembly factor BamB